MGEIRLDPNYENTAKFFARAFTDHSFDQGATEPVVSFIEQIRYLTQTDLPAVQRVIDSISGISLPRLPPVLMVNPDGKDHYPPDRFQSDMEELADWARDTHEDGGEF